MIEKARIALAGVAAVFDVLGGTHEIKQRQIRLANKKPGRNDLCPCGSGKKFKNCCINKAKWREEI